MITVHRRDDTTHSRAQQERAWRSAPHFLVYHSVCSFLDFYDLLHVTYTVLKAQKKVDSDTNLASTTSLSRST